jgi:hypothetical protein
MSDCQARDIQEMLPDLLHRMLSSDDRERVEAHRAGCESCREELAVIRTVKAAAVFVPPIDVGKIVRQIPPYTPIEPAVRAPARARATQWLVAATVGILIIGGGSVIWNRQPGTPDSAVTATPPLPAPDVGSNSVQLPAQSGAIQAVSSAAPTFALAADVTSLSDRDLVQLMNEMDDFDALPNAEPEPVIAVDTSESL